MSSEGKGVVGSGERGHGGGVCLGRERGGS